MAKAKKRTGKAGKIHPTKLTLTFRSATPEHQAIVNEVVAKVCALVAEAAEKIRPGAAQEMLDSVKKSEGSMTMSGTA